MPLTPAQTTVAESNKRFRVLVSGRRFGKTYLAIRELARYARIPNSKCWYVAPTYSMGKQTVWDTLKDKLIQLKWVKKINESDLTIHLVNGSSISIRSADRPDRLRGVGLDFIILDEFADIDSSAWYEVLRPTLSDTNGSAFFCGTPKGIGNWAYELYNQQDLDPKQWESFTYTTLEGGQVSKEEVEQAQRDLDSRTYKQEYEASWETYSGTIYYNYGKHSVYHDHIVPDSVLHIGLDFNIDGFPAAIAQKTEWGFLFFDEVVMYGSNTDEMCAEIKLRYPNHKIFVYPDASARARKTSAGGRTDLTILQNNGFIVKARHNNPPVRDRINAVNSALLSADGTVRVQVTPNCKNIINSLSRQMYKPGTSQPDNNDNLSHMADAFGYLVEYNLPLKSNRKINTDSPRTFGIKTL